MDSPSTSAAALKLEIARLSGVINRHKSSEPSRATGHPTSRPRPNVYINPNYKPLSKTSTPAASLPPPQSQPRPSANAAQKRDVVIGGVPFESSGRSLVRKDLAKPPSSSAGQLPASRPPSSFSRTNPGNAVPSHRPYKPKMSRRINRNMTLDNTRRPYQSRRLATKRKYYNKPCPRFTTTGACNRGLTCMYQHDPNKIAICWPFLQGSCPHTAETCPLSHDPTPERTPLCVHFANNGRCTRANCPFPHVRVGQRAGVCRDFAVLGFCEHGLDCEHQHVRECPDFAERGECRTKGCKLPHVIRANRVRKPAAPSGISGLVTTDAPPTAADVAPPAGSEGADVHSVPVLTAEDGQLGDEFISLTFHESESESGDESEEDAEDEEGDAVSDGEVEQNRGDV